jgi:hypothetical protein
LRQKPAALKIIAGAFFIEWKIAENADLTRDIE